MRISTVNRCVSWGLTGSTVEDEIPESRPCETAVSARERPEAFSQRIGFCAYCPVYQPVDWVRDEIGGELTSVKKIRAGSSGCYLRVSVRSRSISQQAAFDHAECDVKKKERDEENKKNIRGKEWRYRRTLVIFVKVIVRPRFSKNPSKPAWTSQGDRLTNVL